MERYAVDKGGNHLLVVFLPQLELAMLKGFPVDTVEHGGELFRDLGDGDFQGFFDWLRRSDRRIVGVRMGLMDEDPKGQFAIAVRNLSYVLQLPAAAILIEIYFSEDRVYHEEFSNDQDWCGTGLFQSTNGTYAMTFPLYHLTDDELSDVVGQVERNAAERSRH